MFLVELSLQLFYVIRFVLFLVLLIFIRPLLTTMGNGIDYLQKYYVRYYTVLAIAVMFVATSGVLHKNGIGDNLYILVILLSYTTTLYVSSEPMLTNKSKRYKESAYCFCLFLLVILESSINNI